MFDTNQMFTRDAMQASMTFLVQQGAYIEPEVYKVRYQDILYPTLVPVDTSAPEWIRTVTYFSVDEVGKAAWFSGNSQDAPHAEVLRDKNETMVHMGAIGYRYNLRNSRPP